MRPTLDQHYINQAVLTSLRGTCYRRNVGCILVNERNHILSTGYNGPPKGMNNCTLSEQCKGANAKSGEDLDSCNAVHAESNALLQCRDVWEIETTYVTASPCVHCVKLLMNTSCKRIVFLEKYPHGRSKELWESVGREWAHYVDHDETDIDID